MSTNNKRNLVAFWIFGLCNNYAYVVMLSAAVDIIHRQKGEDRPSSSNETQCIEGLDDRHCSAVSTGAVLLADIIPMLLIKAAFPFFMQRVPFGFRHFAVCFVQTYSFLVVAFSKSIAMSLLGVVFASMCTGLGEITFLSLTSYFDKSTISAWSSGTGGAGVVGAFAYAALTEPSLAGFSPSTALLAMLLIPATFAIAYWMILVMPPTVYAPGLSPASWIVPLRNEVPNEVDYQSMHDMSSSTTVASDLRVVEMELSNKAAEVDAVILSRALTAREKLFLIKPLLKYMIPVGLVYMAEYTINQGVVQLIIFNCSRGFGLAIPSQYRWYQVLYQVGVFISRSSINIIRLPFIVLVTLPILQLANTLFVFLDALYFFVPHIVVLFAVIIVEGLLGGASYVNTFDRIHHEVAPDVREYSLSVASLADSLGIVSAGFLSIAVHNFICARPLPALAN